VLEAGAARLAFTTDTFVVRPIEFPGGDIGVLAVHGTLNDLAMCGARPLGLSCALILEEGFPMARLDRVVASIAGAARAAGVPGDRRQKVVERGRAMGLINTSGVGIVPPGRDLRLRAWSQAVVIVPAPSAATARRCCRCAGSS
jgi:hydrogenase expression/formation protein HypE